MENLENALIDFYESLWEKQHRLGREFEKILYENFRDFYVKSEDKRSD